MELPLKITHCKICNTEITTKRIGRRLYCDACRAKINLEYQTAYQKAYKANGHHKKENKRHYMRNGVGELEYLNYCKNNFDKVDGCLNCICPDCLEPEKSDDFLPWEQEGFNENNYIETDLY